MNATATYKFRRIAPGYYRNEERDLTISRVNFGYGDEWLVEGPNFVLDPIPTLRDAKAAAANCEEVAA